MPESRIMIGHHQFRLAPKDAKSINVWRIVGEMCKAYLDDPSICGDREWEVVLKGFCDKTEFKGRDRATFERKLTSITNKRDRRRRLHVLRRLSRQLAKEYASHV